MNQKTLVKLAVGCLVLWGVYAYTVSIDSKNSGEKEIELFSDINGETVHKLVLDQGPTSIELLVKDGAWTVPSRGDYRADSGKVRSLLLKTLSLIVNQKVTELEEGFAKLGLTDEKVKMGNSRILMFDNTDKQLGGLILGDLRKSKLESGHMVPNGQYVKPVDENVAYVVSTPMTVVASASYWLDTTLTNILNNRVLRVTQLSINNEEKKVDFVLERGPTKLSELEYVGSLAESERIEDSLFAQVKDGLADLKFYDVTKNDDDSVKDLTFDKQTKYELENGLVYNVISAEKGEAVYVKLSVDFDEVLAKESQARAENIKQKELEESQAQKSSASDSSQSSSASNGVASLIISNKEEADKISKQYEPWIFEFQKYQGSKFRNKKDDLIIKKIEDSKQN